MSFHRNALRILAPLAVIGFSGFVATHLGARQPWPAPMPQSADGAKSSPAFSEPGISPDGKEIAFVSGADIWTVPISGGNARLLISNPAIETRPLYSPDGTKLAFGSTRTGGGDVYVLTFANGDLRRLTYDDGNESPTGWSHDGRWIYFMTTGHDISGMNDIYRVGVEGGTPMPVAADRYANEFFAAPSPSGEVIAITARGTSSSQWWRKGRSHLDDAEIDLVHETNPPTYEALTDSEAKEMWPMWSADGKSIYYVSDRVAGQNIWVRPASKGGAARQITHFNDGRVLWPTISGDGKTIVFERDFAIWKLDTLSGKAEEVHITRIGVPSTTNVEHLSLANGFSGLALSPDGKKVVFTAHGQLFAASAKDGGDAMRVTHTSANESDVIWAPDSKEIVYVSDREGTPHIYEYDFTKNQETRLTNDAAGDSYPLFSPDGKTLAFIRADHELRVIDMASKKERLMATGALERPPLGAPHAVAFSPDNKWIAYLNYGPRGFRNVMLVPVDGGDAKEASFIPNANAGSLVWSPDGTYLLLITSQRTEPGQVVRVDLVPHAPKFREDQFRELFEDAPRGPGRGRPQTAPANSPDTAQNSTAQQDSQKTDDQEKAADNKKPAAKPVQIVWEGIRERLTRIPVGVDVNEQVISPDGKTLLVNAAVAGQDNLYVYSLDELSREPAVARQLTSTAGFKRNAQFSPDGKEVFYLEQGRIQTIQVESRQGKPVAVTADLDVDFQQEKFEMFQQAWNYLRENFFDAKMNGVDWNAVHAAYEPRVTGAANADELRRDLSLMVGELNSSHSGVGAPPAGGRGGAGGVDPTGRLGLSFDRTEYESNGHLKITEVLALGPAAIAGDIKPGNYLVAVDGANVGAHTNLDSLLQHKSGHRVELTIANSANGEGSHTTVVRPISMGAEKNLLYREWVEQRRAYVEKISGGRLGYVHMADMSENSLEQLYMDLDVQNQARDGVVIDVRNNNGGFVNVYAIDVLARRPYLTMTPRGFEAYPARAQLGQHALERPTILVTNQHSLSDAEDFTEGYRALKLGKVVGEPTAGWIIYTSNVNLVDGTSVRMPNTRILTAEGEPMELHPRPVDVPVTRPVGESYSGKDSQLDAAVRELLAQIGGAKPATKAGTQ